MINMCYSSANVRLCGLQSCAAAAAAAASFTNKSQLKVWTEHLVSDNLRGDLDMDICNNTPVTFLFLG